MPTDSNCLVAHHPAKVVELEGLVEDRDGAKMCRLDVNLGIGEGRHEDESTLPPSLLKGSHGS